MQLPLEIAVRGTTLPPRFGASVARRVEKLERFHPRIVSCRVTLERPVRRRETGDPHAVRLELTLSGEDVFVTRQTGETPTTALQRAFDAATRRLQDATRRQRGQVKAHAEMPLGVVRILDPLGDEGVIETEAAGEVGFTPSELRPRTLRLLEVGMPVRFTLGQREGRPWITHVAPVNRRSSRSGTAVGT